MDNLNFNSEDMEEISPSFEEVIANIQPLSILREEMQADIFVVSGPMERSLADDVVDRLRSLTDKKPNCLVYVCTFGGDPDAAYIIAKAFQNHYEHFSVYISGFCKSAGTLLVLGADEIVMSEKGELGPLDVQLRRDDDLGGFLSGLDVATSLSKLGDEAFEIFEKSFLQIIGRSGGSITTKTAADIAVQLAVGIVSPLAAQLDVSKFVESARSMDIAIHYGIRLGARPEIVYYLATGYPSHSFVIGFEEVSQLFPSTRLYNEIEMFAELHIQSMLLKSEESECIRSPHPNGLVVLLNVDMQTEQNIDEIDKQNK